MSEILIDHRLIAASFSRAAGSYDQAARLQREVGDILLERLTTRVPQAERILDFGSGTGLQLPGLAGFYEGAELTTLDLSLAMLGWGRRYHVMFHDFFSVAGDINALPFANGTFSLLHGSLVMQWVACPEMAFREARRVLKPGGWLAFSSLGPLTLEELRQAWRAVDHDMHVNPFTEQSVLVEALKNSGFVPIHIEQETRRYFFTRVTDLVQELKSLGAHNLNPGRPRGLTGRRRWQTMIQAYERQREPDGLPASFRVTYIVAKTVD